MRRRTGAAAISIDHFARPRRLEQLKSGLQVAVVPSARAPVVASAIVYRAGARDDPPGFGGSAHFLEHMMFKGARRFGAGEIDRITRALGGSNNAFTGHDSTLYYFTFAADRWQQALDFEVDRLRAPRLAAADVKSERQVILEELAMYEGEAWDALDQAVHSAFYGEDHPYGRPVLGSRADLRKIGARSLTDFHRRACTPANATVVVVGDVDPDAAVAAVAERFDALPSGSANARGARLAAPPPKVGRVERRQGEVARLMVALPAPFGGGAEHAHLRMLLAILGSGRSSRLHRALVDDGQLCVWASADLNETVEAGCAVCATEVVPGKDPARVEALVVAELARLVAEPPSEEELARARQMLAADWLFGHEKVDQQAFLIGTSLALFDADHASRYFADLQATGRDELAAVADRYLRPERHSVFGWSLPQ